MAARARMTIEEFLALARDFIVGQYPGVPVDRVQFARADGRPAIVFSIPPPQAAAAGAAPRGEARPSADFATLDWFGRQYGFTPAQRPVVRVLYEAWEDGAPEMGQAAVLEAAGSEARQLRDLFRNSDAWGTLIVRGQTRDAYRLREPE